MSGNITAEGICADLSAMHRIGLGGSHLFNVAYGEPPGFVVVYSDAWHARVQPALREANRLGLEITMHICPGWSQSGGPWVPPELAMQEIAVARTNRIGWIHRRIPGEPPTDIYFVCNRDPTSRCVEISFRITDRRPEFWDPNSGRIEPAPQWRTENDRILLPLDFDPCGSVFVVFRASAAGTDSIVRWTGPGEGAWLTCDVAGAPRVTAWTNGEWRKDTAAGRTLLVRAAAVPAPEPLVGPWRVEFPVGRSAPPAIELERLMSLLNHPEEGVRHFSGTATWILDVPPPVDGAEQDPALRRWLALGTVNNLAEVIVNGRSFGVLWRPPCRVDVTAAWRPAATNRVEVRVTNLWINRLIGDSARPQSERVTWTTDNPWGPKDPLPESGLIGPVELRHARVVLAQSP